MHVLLVTPSDRREGFEYVYSGRENLGVEYLLAALRATGVEAKSRNENIPGTLLAEDTDLSRHDVIGFSLPFWEYRKRYVESINRIAQRTDALLLIGGHASTIGAKYFLHKCPRLAGVVMGEGEETLVEIVRSLESRGTCEGVPGLMTRSGFEQRRELVELDDLPFPHRDELRQSLDSGLAVQEALVESTRGCTYRCSFCSIPPYYKHAHKKRWRERSVENICAELTQLVNSFPEVNLISFTDDNFMGFNSRFHDRAIRIAEHLHSLREDIVFEVVCRVDAVEPEPFARLAELGMVGVYLGIESGVQRILDAFQKKTTVNQNLRAVQI
ncbi:MAG: B12-binding domain-containing radical SAM protein, partial [Candidatus Hydrogenedentes bacterium]|nr:B12-binding domain-containing radical SAM protein [Candidatus Hydrogenedentota bacterium]